MGIIYNSLVERKKEIEINYTANNFKEIQEIINKIKQMLKKKNIKSIKILINAEYFDEIEDLEKFNSYK